MKLKRLFSASSPIKFNFFRKVRMYGKTIFYLDDKSDIAAKALLENIKYKIGYNELNEVVKVFNIQLKPDEKSQFITKRKRHY